MRRCLPVLAILLAWAGSAHGHGLLIPEEKSVPPLAMLNHHVTIAIEDQVAVTRVEQTFRNHTDRRLEATYVFPVPKGASVNRFTMWVDGKETKGELIEADKAKAVYTSIVRRTQDPGLLEYIGNDLLQMKVFPIEPHKDQRVALSFSAVAHREGGLVEYIYPLKTDGKATATLEKFSIDATIKSQHAVTNVYSPTHSITVKRTNDQEVSVSFDKNQGLLDKDFQLFYGTGDKDVGLTALTHRPIANEKGFITLLVEPKVTMSAKYQVPRDMVLVLDTSGSMRGVKMEQARKALKYCLDNLGKNDRFALINFATTVNKYRDRLLEASSDQLDQARKWVNDLEATGGTAINDALLAALDYRTGDEGRSFTIVFFTDGEPTIGETHPEKILKNVFAKNTANTRIFTFGVGDDVNATLLDRLAEGTRAVSTYVRPAEDIEAKVSSLHGKISNPVLTNLKLSATNDVSFSEVYPAQLPDLFHGTQLVVFGRYSGKGPAAIKLTGQVGMETKEFVYELTFPEKTNDAHDFVEHLWARRKVGYLLDQIRANGEKPELKDEVIALAKRYGITTPYTSWLIVPDGAVPVAREPGKGGKPDVSFHLGRAPVPPGLMGPGGGENKPVPVTEFARQNVTATPPAGPGGGFGGTGLNGARGGYVEKDLKSKGEGKGSGGDSKGASDDAEKTASKEALDKKAAYDRARDGLARRALGEVQAGKLGVDLSVQMNKLRNQTCLDQTALKQVNGRNCLEIGGVWIDEGFKADMKTLVVKAQSDAYFKILDKNPKMLDVFRLGNYLVWVAPNGTALVIDTTEGKEKLDDREIEALFVAKK
jgi:Ca-activated chloride channel family protein